MSQDSSYSITFPHTLLIDANLGAEAVDDNNIVQELHCSDSQEHLSFSTDD